MRISTHFDSGNIEVISIADTEAKLNIRKDTHSNFKQWFHFRVTDVQDEDCSFAITDAAEAFVPEGWENYNVCASYDNQEWFRVPTTYVDGVLSWDFSSDYNSVYFAYFAPYPYQRHLDLIQEAQMIPFCQASVIGQTVEGRDIDMLTVGDSENARLKFWVIARQHPGETMAEWFVEGFLNRLLDGDDSVSRKLLEEVCFYVIPNMNIDGSIAGNLRANAAGANLNRAWAEPNLKESPEVYYTLNAMDKVGVDFMLDVHGDESIPYNFVTTSEGVPGYNDKLHQFEENFKRLWMRLCPDFQDTHSYGKDEPGKANLTVCSNAINHRFKCPSFTLEMPFKDIDDMPDETYGWSAERSMRFGESILPVMLEMLEEA